MTATIARICSLSGVIYRGTCDCPQHRARRAVDASRRAAKPQRRVWDSPEWRTARKAALRRDGHRCRYTPDERFAFSDVGRCNEPATSVHHSTPVAEGGRFDPADLVSMCRRHHGMLDGRRAAG